MVMNRLVSALCDRCGKKGETKVPLVRRNGGNYAATGV